MGGVFIFVTAHHAVWNTLSFAGVEFPQYQNEFSEGEPREVDDSYFLGLDYRSYSRNGHGVDGLLMEVPGPMDRMQQFEHRYGPPIVKFREWFRRAVEDEERSGERNEGGESSSAPPSRRPSKTSAGAWKGDQSETTWWGAVRDWMRRWMGNFKIK